MAQTTVRLVAAKQQYVWGLICLSIGAKLTSCFSIPIFLNSPTKKLKRRYRFPF